MEGGRKGRGRWIICASEERNVVRNEVYTPRKTEDGEKGGQRAGRVSVHVCELPYLRGHGLVAVGWWPASCSGTPYGYAPV